VRVVLHRRWQEVCELSPSWNGLLSASGSDTIFLTWEWMDAWWRHYGRGRPLFVLSAWDDAGLAGIAPFYVDTIRQWGRDWRCLRLMGDGSGDSDYLDCIVRRGQEEPVMADFLSSLETHREQWDCVEFHGTPENSPCLRAVVCKAREASWSVASEPIACAVLPLPRTWDEYLRQLRPRFRTKVRSTLNFFDKLDAGWTECKQEAQVEQWLPTLFDLHTRRWKTQSQAGVFGNPDRRNFYQDVSRAALRQGWLAFHRLDWGERALAMQYGFLYGNRFHLLQEGYEPEFAGLRPGLALRAWLMRRWIESGVQEYDFLAGAAPYKLEWGAKIKQAVLLRLAVKRAAAMAFIQTPQVQENFKATLRPFVPKALGDWRRKRRERLAQVEPEAQQSSNGTGTAWTRRAAAALYAATPLGALGRRLASRYELAPGRGLRRRKSPRCQILHYHHVNDDADPFFPAVSVELFRSQMQHVARKFSVVSLDELASGEAWRKSDFCVAITFDDGYRDNFSSAFPVLKEMGLPATVFLATSHIGSDELTWYDKVFLAFKLTTQTQLTLEPAGVIRAPLETLAARLQTLSRVVLALRAMDETRRQQTTAELFRALRMPAKLHLPNFMLDWDEVREMSRHGIQFGAHTQTHPVLAGLSRERLDAEITGSKRVIEEKLQVLVRHFAFPFGSRNDFDRMAKQAVEEAGFETAATTIWGYNSPHEDRFELKRFTPWESDPRLFALKLDWYRLRGIAGETAMDVSLRG